MREPRTQRYDSISTYLAHACISETDGSDKYNDVPCETDPQLRALLLERGVDAILAQHIAHLFVRDPLVIFEGAVEELDDDVATEHWENLQSTNWQTMRWKPPPNKPHLCSPHIGWRVEFRSMEVQLTDYENAAFSVFIVLLTR